MASEQAPSTYPAGTGWAAGFALGAVVGAIVWWFTGQATFGLIMLAGAGTVLGNAIESSMDVRPLTETQRRTLRILLVAGVLVVAFLLVYLLFLR